MVAIIIGAVGFDPTVMIGAIAAVIGGTGHFTDRNAAALEALLVRE
jgi:hypothetical protein